MQALDALALLDAEGSGRFDVPGYLRAVDLTSMEVLRAISDPEYFVKHVAGGAPMPWRQIPAMQAAWAATQGLPTEPETQRLVWIVQHFWREMEVDLLQHSGVDLAQFWARRRWRQILNLVDHLPRATWTHQAMVNHPEYAAKMAEAIAKAHLERDDEEDSGGGSMVEHTPEAALLKDLIDCVNALRATIIMANSKAGSPAPKIAPYPRPKTLVDTMTEKAKRQARWSAHHKLVARVLPGREES